MTRAFALTLLLIAVASPATGADAPNWKEANRRSAEALERKNYREGADLARQAFELYAGSPNYTAENHAQLLLNLVGARAIDRNVDAALRDLDSGVESIARKGGGNNPILLPVWDEGIRIAEATGEHAAADRYYGAANQLAEKLWGKDDPRAISLQYRWANGLRAHKGADWARTKLRDARARVKDGAANEALMAAIDVSLGRLELEDQRPKTAIPILSAAAERLEARRDGAQDTLLQIAYAHLAVAYTRTGDQAAAEGARQRLQASFGDSAELTPISRLQPLYPRRAASNRLSGYVDMRVDVKPDGTVRNVVVLSSEPAGVFDDAAMQAVRGWKFRPHIVNGEPRPASGLQRIEFQIEG